jgi:hypothetical protein
MKVCQRQRLEEGGGEVHERLLFDLGQQDRQLLIGCWRAHAPNCSGGGLMPSALVVLGSPW